MTTTAKHHGVCPSCTSTIRPGDVIVMTAALDWAHEVCADVDDLTPKHPVCTECWLEHPEGACDR